MNTIKRFAARAPFTVGCTFVLLVMALATGPIGGPERSLRLLLGTGYESVVENGHWWSILTAVFVVDNGAELLLAIPAAIFLLGFAEHLLGTGRTVLAFFATATIGTGLGILAQMAGIANGEFWSRGVSELSALDPFTAIFGTIMAASYSAGSLWRRRIRVLTLAAALVLLLYSGQPSDVYRLIATIAGLGVGSLLRPLRIDLTWRRSSHHEARTLLAVIVGMVAIGPVVTMFSGARFGALSPLGLLLTQGVPAATDALDRCLIGDITRQCVRELMLARVDGVGPVLVSVLPLVALLVAAFGLARGRRFAAWFAIGVSSAMAALGAWYYILLPVSGQPYVWHWPSTRYWEIAVVLLMSVLVPLLLAVILALNLRRFPVRSSPGRLRRFFLIIVGCFLGLSALYVGVGWLLRDHFRPTVDLVTLLADVPERFIPVAFLRLERLAFLPTDPVTTALYRWVGPIFWIILIVNALIYMRSNVIRVGGADQDSRLRALLSRGGGGSLAFMSTWAGNALWFTATGSTAIAYQVVNGAAITLSEPIGPDDEAETAVADFAVMCDDHGWVPVFYSMHEQWKPFFLGMGWQTMGVGEETVLRPRSWSTTGKKWQNIRSSLSRAEREGVRAEWTTYRALSVAHSSQISEISEQWVQDKRLPELGFTLGGLDELRDPAVRLMLAIDSTDRVIAVTSWMPSWRDGIVIGWTLDFMRRTPDNMNGVMEFLIAQTAAMLQQQPEIEFLSLSTAPLAQTQGDDTASSLAARILDFLGRTLEPVYGFRSLLAFKRKFQPEFVPLFMAYPDPVVLPAIGLALARAYVPTLSVRESLEFVRSLGADTPARPESARPPAALPG